MKLDDIHIGTSGWRYEHWRGSFYPEELSATEEFISYYAEKFNTVEVNTSFYHLPNEKTVKKWSELTPEHFIFTCKASRYITHMKKLCEPGVSLGKLYRVLENFGEKLGPILFQLPPHWRKNTDRLAQFLSQLSKEHRYAFEFRNTTWLAEDTYELLRDYNVALCFYDFKQYQPPEIITSDLIYIRPHGPNETPYTGSYDEHTITDYAKKIRNWRNDGKLIYCYFDNDEKAYAPKDALRLIEQVKHLS